MMRQEKTGTAIIETGDRKYSLTNSNISAVTRNTGGLNRRICLVPKDGFRISSRACLPISGTVEQWFEKADHDIMSAQELMEDKPIAENIKSLVLNKVNFS